MTFSSQSSTAVEESEFDEADYCDSMPGIQPHNYAAIVDVVVGSGIWAFCTQCGDYFNLDGTAAPPPAGAPPSSLGPSSAAGAAPAKRPGSIPFP